MVKHKSTSESGGAFVIAVLIIVCIASLSLRYYQSVTQEVSPAPQVLLDAISCEVAGGVWKACESPCATGEICATICVERCECGNDGDCPFGYHCKISDSGTRSCVGP